MAAYLRRIQPLLPPHVAPQDHALAWLKAAAARALAGDPQKTRRVTRLYERFGAFPGIRQRRSMVTDYMHDDWERMELFRPWPRRDATLTPWFTPPLEKRMEIFEKSATSMIAAAYAEDCAAPTSLIEVSCTGYTSPSAAQMLLAEKRWEDKTRLLKLGHMGCYAALPALDTARALLAADGDIVSLFLVELCSLHLRPETDDLDQIITNVLFGDGAVRLDVSSAPEGEGFRLIGYRERLVPDTLNEMSWHLADSSFAMTLGKEVPALIGKIIKDEVAALLRAHGFSLADVGRFAVHPGGPRIIEAAEVALGASEQAVQHSKDVLAEHGNMSSTTLPHIWDRMLRDTNVGNELIVSMGFGPGLTVALSLMEKVSR